MNCIVHPHVAAVGECGLCGAGLCGPCREGSLYTWEGRPLCPACNLGLAQELLEGAELEVRSAKRRLAFLSICVGAGVLAALTVGSPAPYASIAGLGGFLVAWRHMGPLGLSFSSPDAILYSLFQLQLRIVLCTILGAVFAPFLLVATFFRLRRARREAKELAADVRLLSGGSAPFRATVANHGAGPEMREARQARRAAERRSLVRYFGRWRRTAVPPPAVRAATSASTRGPRAGTEPADRTAPSAPAAGLSALDARIAQRRASLDKTMK